MGATCTEPWGALPPYTFTSATTEKIESVVSSMLSRICCVFADSSMPTVTIHVITAIQRTPSAVTAAVEFAALSQPNSRNV